MKKIVSGNEAIALSFGVPVGFFASGYPGTPSTETLEVAVWARSTGRAPTRR
jgi:indolepyruvate ferredoxin oxidoreductase alpha subunit